MRSLSSMFRACWHVLGLALLMATSAHAQREPEQQTQDVGQYQILQARYGSEQQNVDVTERLRELARSDLSVRMGNSTFGVDPAPGVVKTLRIFARGPGGAQRTFEYREGSVIDGTLFTGWSGGGWGQGQGGGWNGGWNGGHGGGDDGQYQILQARYGTAQRNVDVTQRLKELAQQDQTFRMGNDTFGVDPAPGVVKTLRIYARGPRGSQRTFEYREGSVIDGAMFTGWRGGRWGHGGWKGGWGGDNGPAPRGGVTIAAASYGVPGSQIDVTTRLRSLVRDGQLDITVNNQTLAYDPAPKRRKSLWVTYAIDGRTQPQVRVDEDQRITLP